VKAEPIAEQAQAVTASATTETNPQSAIRNPQSSEATEVVMPQMGESITEGTVSKWLKAVGDKIEKDEPLLEISTDKVDAEVPSPAAGTLLEIRVNEGETVEVGSVVALVGAEGAAAVKSPESRVESQPAIEQKAAAATTSSQARHIGLQIRCAADWGRKAARSSYSARTR